MSKREDALKRLDRVLASIEVSILRAPDQELLVDRAGAARTYQLVQRLIAQNLARPARRERPVLARKKEGTASIRQVPKGAEARIRLLRVLARSKADLPASFRAAFAGRDKPSKQKVDELLLKAIRLGLLKK